MTDIAEIEVAAVAAALAGGASLLDVREPGEWEAGHAPGARHVPLGQLPDRMGELERTGLIVVVCRSGGRSALATEWLGAAGFDAANLVGGMQEWAHAGLAVETDDGGPGRVA
ncbi:MAG TPA: rhodanese-like domain-containing protein [Acidimicrobiales bacterium]|nr:rhodanese-like domain-containing protein [Acidimicrobiales bacterium]